MGGSGVQIPRRGLTENFNMAKTNNLAIPGGPDPLSPPPPDSPMHSTCRFPAYIYHVCLFELILRPSQKLMSYRDATFIIRGF